VHIWGSAIFSGSWHCDIHQSGLRPDLSNLNTTSSQVAAATDRRNLRIFTVGGFQREVLSLPGPVVAIAGQGSNLAVAVHLALPLPGNQNIGVAVFNLAGKNPSHPISVFQPIPLSPKSTLAWIGFTDEDNVSADAQLKGGALWQCYSTDISLTVSE